MNILKAWIYVRTVTMGDAFTPAHYRGAILQAIKSSDRFLTYDRPEGSGAIGTSDVRVATNKEVLAYEKGIRNISEISSEIQSEDYLEPIIL